MDYRPATSLVCLILVGCATPLPPDYNTVGVPTRKLHCPDYSSVSPGFYGGDGSSQEQAIESVGFDFGPYRWIAENYPGARIEMQELVIPPSNLRYDVMHIVLPDGEEREIWFWLTGGYACF